MTDYDLDALMDEVVLRAAVADGRDPLLAARQFGAARVMAAAGAMERRARVFLALCAVSVALMSAVACGGNVGNVTPAPPTQAGPTATPYLYCPPQTEEGITVFCLIIEPTPSDATRAVYATRLAEWDALGTPTRAEWATMDAATTAMAATVAAVAATDTAEALATMAVPSPADVAGWVAP
jgi:hypothetical protein